MKKTSPLPIVVLISGNGSNLQAFIDGAAKDLPIEIRAVISNESDAYGLQRAQNAGIPAHAIPHKNFPNRPAFEQALSQQIDYYRPKLVVLAGFMRRLQPAFVHHYHGNMINIHPSLLPKYPGLDTHQRALAAGDPHHGITIHFVNEEVDGGPIICQASLPIHSADSEDSLKQRIHQLEHRLYPEVLRWIATGRVHLTSEGVTFDGQLLSKAGKLINTELEII